MTIIELLRLSAAIVSLAMVIFMLRGIRQSQRSRTAAYYTTRREAGEIASRHFATSFLLAIAAVLLFIISLIWPAEVPPAALPPGDSISSSTLTAQTTVYIVPTSTPPVNSGISVPSPSPSSPEPTPSDMPTMILTRPPTKTASVADGRMLLMTLSAISLDVDANGRPISPTTEFTKGVATVYIFYNYHDVPLSSLVRQNWLCDGKSVHTNSTVWSLTGSGTASISWSPPQGYKPCLYEVRIILSDVKQFSANFVVR